VSVSEHLWNFKTLLHNSVICRSNFIQTPAIWLKFSDPNPGLRLGEPYACVLRIFVKVNEAAE